MSDFLKDIEAGYKAQRQAEKFIASLPGVDLKNADAASLNRFVDLLEAFQQAERSMGNRRYFTELSGYPIDSLPKHKAFFNAGDDYPERLFMAANRIGKSIAGAYELTCHLTGEYPIWWTGRVFDSPIDAWVAGADAKAVRDTAQLALMGPPGEWGTGMIPADRIGQQWMLSGTPQAIDILKVKHKSGGWSTVGFKNYQQEVKAFYGTSRHVIWLDEECPLEIYNECNIRTAVVSGDTKGIIFVTFTPLHGLTNLIVNFCKDADFLVGSKPFVSVDQELEGNKDDEENNLDKREQLVDLHRRKAVVQAGWDDAPWLDKETKARLLEDTPLHLRAARSKGEPGMGSGNVYAVALEDIVVPPFAIPKDWKKMYALDVGWNRTACLWIAIDPSNDVVYAYDEHYIGEQHPAIHALAIKSRGDWIRGVIDPASRGRSPQDGQQLIRNYKDAGLKILPANNEVDAGIQKVHERLAAGKLKFFSTCVNLQKEYALYRRDVKGKIIKENDHLMDCLRYDINNIIRASNQDTFRMTKGEGSGLKYSI